MKKVFLWIIPSVVVALFLIGIIVVLNVEKNKTNAKIYAESISCKYEKLTFIKDSTYTLTKDDFVVVPAKCNQKVMISTNDSNLLEVNTLTGEIVAKAVGTCKIFASIKSSDEDVLQIEIDVEVKQAGKLEKEVNLSFKLSDGMALITYVATSSFEEYDLNIIDGTENLSIEDPELGKITIRLNHVGSATICLENSVEKVLYHITIS